MSVDLSTLLEPIKALHRDIRDRVLAACEAQSLEELSSVRGEQGGDMLFHIDRVSEEVLLRTLEDQLGSSLDLVLVGEGLSEDGCLVFPEGADPDRAAFRMIVDPIDGTRGLMYQKRSAWILTGLAPNRGEATCLSDIELAVQTEIPLVKQHLSDTFWAIKGQGACAERWNRMTGERQNLPLRPSREDHLKQGFVTMARYFPGAQQCLGGVYDAWIGAEVEPVSSGYAPCFEDQYISSAGHLAELMLGHDRVVVDVRPLVQSPVRGLCSHPYDLCTELIAREAGVIVSDPLGKPLRAPLDVFTDVAWVGMANADLYSRVFPGLQQCLRDSTLLPAE